MLHSEPPLVYRPPHQGVRFTRTRLGRGLVQPGYGLKGSVRP